MQLLVNPRHIDNKSMQRCPELPFDIFESICIDNNISLETMKKMRLVSKHWERSVSRFVFKGLHLDLERLKKVASANVSLLTFQTHGIHSKTLTLSGEYDESMDANLRSIFDNLKCITRVHLNMQPSQTLLHLIQSRCARMTEFHNELQYVYPHISIQKGLVEGFSSMDYQIIFNQSQH